MTREELREKVAMAIAGAEIAYFGPRSSLEQCMNWANEPDCYRKAADAAIALVLEEAARVAEGSVYRTSGSGEVALRGTDGGNWSVPMPISGFKGSDYGTGRYDAAAAIRALVKPGT